MSPKEGRSVENFAGVHGLQPYIRRGACHTPELTDESGAARSPIKGTTMGVLRVVVSSMQEPTCTPGAYAVVAVSHCVER